MRHLRAFSILRVLGALFLVLIAGGVLVVVIVRTAPGGDAVDWAARKVVSVVEASLIPSVEFERFEYRAPRTLVFHEFALVAPDSTRVIEAVELAVELTAIPSRAEPVRIEHVSFRGGLVHLIETRQDDGTFGFRGLVPFVDTPEDQPTPADDRGDRFEQDERLSDILRIKRMILEDCGIVYEPASGQPPMRIAGLTTEFILTPVEDAAGFWHTFEFDIDRGEVLSGTASGRIDLDEVVIALERFEIGVNLDEEIAAELPPAVQAILQEYDVKGRLNLAATGTIPTGNLNAAELDIDVALDGVNAAFGDYRIPLDAGRIDLLLRDGIASTTGAHFDVLDGELTTSIRADLRETNRVITFEWGIEGVQLDEMLRLGTPEGEEPTLAGTLACAGSGSMSVAEGVDSLRGDGVIDISNGRIQIMPLMARLASVVDVLGNKPRDSGFNDSAFGRFSFRGPAVDFSEIRMTSSTFAARGNGVVWFNQDIDLVLNAGPVERVQDMLGGLGRILGAVTDQIVKYRVRGSVGQPTVKVVPLGVGATPDRSELP